LSISEDSDPSGTERVALVTGAGQGMGRGIAAALAKKGVIVAVNDLHADRAEAVAKEVRDSGGSALAVPFDATSRPAIDDAVAIIGRELGPIDILVNNAGVVEGTTVVPFLDSKPDDWMPQYALNLFGSMHCIHAVAPGMVVRGWGRVIQISSGAASTRGSGGVSLYASAKAGIEGLIRHLAHEVGPAGVTVNALALGLMENAAGKIDQQRFEAFVSTVPVRRLGRAAEVGAAVDWLVSDDAGFVTGQVIHLNGGAFNGR
jgi:NAD(P)-dependent dehydrogenase (short-subunit alcohol dehydrogenase family)